MAEPIEMPFGILDSGGLKKAYWMGSRFPCEGVTFRGKDMPGHARQHSAVSCVVWVVDLGGLKEAKVQSYSPGCANVPSWEGTLA